MDPWNYPTQTSVAERQKLVEKATAKAEKKGQVYVPVPAFKGPITKTFWGNAWCENLERYSDYANRLPKGRTYVRTGSVMDLQILPGCIQAEVMGSSQYQVKITIKPVEAQRWKAICTDCAASIDSLVNLLQGKLAQPVMQRICQKETGLFPAPLDIKLSCTCPDWADMCKHAAAALYAVGMQLDKQPELLFTLRQVDAQDLVAQALAGMPQTGKKPAAERILSDGDLAGMFGLDIAGPGDKGK